MEQNQYANLLARLNALTLFRPLLSQEPLRALRVFLERRICKDSRDVISSYAAFVSRLYEESEGDLGRCVLEQVLTADTPYVRAVGRGEAPPACMGRSLTIELETLQAVAGLTPEKLLEGMLSAQEYLPDFSSSPADLSVSYFRRMEEISRFGYGIFARYHMFCLDCRGAVTPVRRPDPVLPGDFVDYQRERALVFDNIRALLAGRPAANMLLSGDAGTGKSSTIKAACNAMKSQGLRVIELRRDQLQRIPALLDELSGSPLKFILFIDDLSFQEGDAGCNTLKAALEGSVSARGGNVAICATSNRRHLVRETFSGREGDDVHRGEAMQEAVSLSERFGLHVAFQKPDKEGYLRIVRRLAEARGLNRPGLDTQAERFALTRGGRSPRAARQFVDSLAAAEAPENAKANLFTSGALP